MTKILYGNSECKKIGFKKHLQALFLREFSFMFVLLISNHTDFLVQFEFFKKLKLHEPNIYSITHDYRNQTLK